MPGLSKTSAGGVSSLRYRAEVEALGLGVGRTRCGSRRVKGGKRHAGTSLYGNHTGIGNWYPFWPNVTVLSLARVPEVSPPDTPYRTSVGGRGHGARLSIDI